MTLNRLFIITGDYSGDMHAANVVKALRALKPSVEIEAVGGERLRAEGVRLLSDQSRMGRLGFGSVLGAPYHYVLGLRILKRLEVFCPDAVLLIDYGVFNLHMAAQLKKRGIRVFYFIPPQLWASRQGRIRKIQRTVDHVFCIFPFEPPLYERYGVPVTYVGHPLVGQLPPAQGREAFCRAHGLNPDAPIIGLFPGSRTLEIDYLLRPMLESIPQILHTFPQAQFVLAQAGALRPAYFEQKLRQALPPSVRLASEAATGMPGQATLHVLSQQNHAVLSVADLAIVASGTVTLEAALYRTPMILLYRMHPWLWAIGRRFMVLPCIGLPNILTNVHQPVVPELLQTQANATEIAHAALPLLQTQSPEHQAQLAAFEQIIAQLNTGDAPQNVAQSMIRLLGENISSEGGQSMSQSVDLLSQRA